MVLLTETVLFYWDCIDYLYRKRTQEAKNDWAGIGEVKDWADKLALSQTLHSRSIPSSRTGSKGSCFKPVTSGICPLTSGIASTQESKDFNSYIHGDDRAKCNAMSNPASKAVEWTDVMVRFFSHDLLLLSYFFVGHYRDSQRF